MPSNPPNSRQAGFSLIELLIGMVIAIEILVAALTVFDVHNRMARVQIQITDMQQSLRVAQYDMVRTTRMAGRGGLPADFRVDNDDISVPWLRGLAVEVARQRRSKAATTRSRSGIDEPVASPGTDILTVRGCLSGLLFQMDPSESRPTSPPRRSRPQGPAERPFAGARAAARRRASRRPMLLQSSVSRGQYVVAEVDGVAGNANDVTLTITFASTLSPPNPLVVALPADFVPGFVCALEEYRYYVRPRDPDANDDRPIKPRLARARMIPGTELPHDEDDANLVARPRRRHLRPAGRARLRHRLRLRRAAASAPSTTTPTSSARRRLLRGRRRRGARHRRLVRQLELGRPGRRPVPRERREFAAARCGSTTCASRPSAERRGAMRSTSPPTSIRSPAWISSRTTTTTMRR